MAQGIQGSEHVWLVMMKAMRALTRYAAAGIEETGLGLSDFGVLEVLLHKGPLPVNMIGPIVDLRRVAGTELRRNVRDNGAVSSDADGVNKPLCEFETRAVAPQKP